MGRSTGGMCILPALGVKHVCGTWGGQSTSAGPAPISAGPQRHEDIGREGPAVSTTASWQSSLFRWEKAEIGRGRRGSGPGRGWSWRQSLLPFPVFPP